MLSRSTDFVRPGTCIPASFSGPSACPAAPGFTLIELIVVIGIVALLMGLLLPVLGTARVASMSAANLSNLRQIGMALVAYQNQHDGFFPMHSSSSDPNHPAYANPRTRWPDHLYKYTNDTQVFISPFLDENGMKTFGKVFAHTAGTDDVKRFGGYGYNYQYLGNSRFIPTFHANAVGQIKDAERTIVLADTAGSRGGVATNRPGAGSEGVYVIDPPLGSARGSATGAYYPGGTDEPNGDANTYIWRSFPAERANGHVGVLFIGGHARTMTLKDMDDSNRDGVKDNGLWNGLGDAGVR